jgi:histidine triad (HIT) family protein
MTCIFCQIAAGAAPATVVYEDQAVIAIRDLAPQAPSHVLVIPRVHVNSLVELEDPALMAALLHGAQRVAEVEKLGNGFRLVTNIGRDGCQSVAHLHFHVLGGAPLGGSLVG